MNSAVRVMVVEPEGRRRNRMAAAICGEPSLLLADVVAGGSRGLERLAHVRPEVLLAGAALADPRVAEFVRSAREILASCDILTIVPQGHESAGLESLAAGAGGCLSDGCSGAELATYIGQLRAGGCPVAPGIVRLLLEHVRALRSPGPDPSPARAAGEPAAALTARESEVACLLASGLSYAQIADRLGVSRNTVGIHIKNIYRKLDVHSATAAVMRIVALNLLPRT